MRTTVSISDELLEAARQRARTSGQTLGSVLEAALRRELARPPDSSAARPAVPVFRDGSGPRPGLDLTSNQALHEAVDEGVPLDRRR